MNLITWIYDKMTYAYAVVMVVGILLAAEALRYRRKPYTHLATSYNFGTPLGDSPYMFGDQK